MSKNTEKNTPVQVGHNQGVFLGYIYLLGPELGTKSFGSGFNDRFHNCINLFIL